MTRTVLAAIACTCAVLLPTAGFAQVSCSREGLQRAVDLYLTAQTGGDTAGLPLAAGLGYFENAAPASIDSGIIRNAMTIDHHRTHLLQSSFRGGGAGGQATPPNTPP